MPQMSPITWPLIMMQLIFLILLILVNMPSYQHFSKSNSYVITHKKSMQW